MRRLFVLIAFLTISQSVAAETVLNREAFMREFIGALSVSEPSAAAQPVSESEVRVVLSGDREYTVYLDNAYATYLLSPETREEIINMYVESAVGLPTFSETEINPAHIIPIVKDRSWLVELQGVAQAHGENELLNYVYEDLNEDLLILFAEDTPTSIRYLTEKNLKDSNIEAAGLRDRAVDNLLGLLPEIQIHGSSGIYMVVADGNYEASLLLADSIWQSKQIPVKGDYVMSIPARDLLFVTGNEDLENIAVLRELSTAAVKDSPYPLIDTLYIYREGSFRRFTP
ncbi:MAG: DUF1444 family protein [Pseudomonas sp.]